MAEEKGIVEYRSRDGQQIKLSPSIIKRFLVSGNSDLVTDQELYLYMGICKSRGLNPFIKDAYLIKYAGNDPAAIIVSIDYYRKRARAQTDCRGWKCGIVVKNMRDEIEYREGAIILDGEVLIGGWFEAMPDGWDVPMKKTVNLNRYIKKTKDGRTTRFWSPENQPEMIVKVVEGQGLRATWPDEFQGLYVDAEMQSQDAQAELDQAVKVKSAEAPKEEKPISEILGKPETRSAAPVEKPYTAPPDPMQTADAGSKARKSAQDSMDAKMEAARAALRAENKARVEKPTDDTPAPETQNVAQPGPQIRPSLAQVLNKFPARLKVTEGFKTLIELAADFPDQLLAILIEKPVESLADLGTALKAISRQADQLEVEPPKAEQQKKANYKPALFNDEPPIPEGPPEW